MASKGKIAIVGSGLIGRSWAMLFASAGYRVAIYDKDSNASVAALKIIGEQLRKLETDGLLRGDLSAAKQLHLITRSEDLKDCLKDAFYVQESVPENVEIKKLVFKQLDEIVSDKTILASSTSCITPSTIAKDLKHSSQMLVAHPANPPYFVPIVEVVPSSCTKPDVVNQTIALMKEIGQKPVLVKKEVYGFAINRMQYAVINECWRLVQEGVMSVKDVDAVMSEGLGMRYAFIGPFETCHLNADGMLDYCDRYSSGIFRVSETFGPVPKMEGPVAQDIHEQLCEMVPLESLDERRKWRDEKLASLTKTKKAFSK